MTFFDFCFLLLRSVPVKIYKQDLGGGGVGGCVNFNYIFFSTSYEVVVGGVIVLFYLFGC